MCESWKWYDLYLLTWSQNWSLLETGDFVIFLTIMKWRHCLRLNLKILWGHSFQYFIGHPALPMQGWSAIYNSNSQQMCCSQSRHIVVLKMRLAVLYISLPGTLCCNLLWNCQAGAHFAGNFMAWNPVTYNTVYVVVLVSRRFCCTSSTVALQRMYQKSIHMLCNETKTCHWNRKGPYDECCAMIMIGGNRGFQNKRQHIWPHFHIMALFPDIEIPDINVRKFWDHHMYIGVNIYFSCLVQKCILTCVKSVWVIHKSNKHATYTKSFHIMWNNWYVIDILHLVYSEQLRHSSPDCFISYPLMATGTWVCSQISQEHISCLCAVRGIAISYCDSTKPQNL